VISPALVPELRVTFAVSVIGEANEMSLFVAVTVPASETAPAPVCANPPTPVIVLPVVVVRRPAFATLIAPDAVTLSVKVKILPVSAMAPAAVSGPLKVVIPPAAAADCVMEVAVTPCVVQLCAEEMRRAPKEVVPPAAPEKRMSAVPAASVKSPGPFSVLAKEII